MHSSSPQAVSRKIILVLVVAGPLLINPWGANMFAPIRAALLYVGAAALLAVTMWGWLAAGEITWVRTRLNTAVALFTVLLGISTVLSVHRYSSIFGHYSRYEGLLAWVAYMVVFWAAMNSYKTMAQLRGLLGWVAVAGGVVALYAVTQGVGLDPVHWQRGLDVSRAFSFLGNPAYLAAYLALVIPVSLGLIMDGDSDVLAKKALAVAFAAMLAALAYTGGRAGTLAVILFLALILPAFRGGLAAAARKIGPVIGLGLAAVLVTLVLLPGKANFTSPARWRMGGQVGVPDTVSGRWLTWKLSTRLVAQRPLLGSGIDTFYLTFPRVMTAEYERTVGHKDQADRPHNDFLQMATAAGLAGLAAYLSVLVGIGLIAFKGLKGTQGTERTLLLGLAGGLFAYVLVLQTHFSTVDVSPLFWAGAGALAGVCISPTGGRTRSFRLAESQAVWVGTAVARGLMLGLVAAAIVFSARLVIADAYFRKALEAEASGDKSAAVAFLSKSVALEPGDDFFVNQLGQTYVVGERTNTLQVLRGVPLLEAAAAMNPRNAYYYLDIGRADLVLYEATRRREFLHRAVKALDYGLRLDPNFSELRQLRAAADKLTRLGPVPPL